MAAHSSIPAWRIPWTEEPGNELQSMGLQRVGHASYSPWGCKEWDTTERLTLSLPLAWVSCVASHTAHTVVCGM